MKVQELLEQLQNFDKNAEVFFNDGGIRRDPIRFLKTEMDSENNPIVILVNDDNV